MIFKDTRNAKQRADTRQLVAGVRLTYDIAIVLGPHLDEQGRWHLNLGSIDQGGLFFNDTDEAVEFFQNLSNDGLTFPLDIELMPVDRCSFCGRARISPDPEPTGKTYTCEHCKKIKAAEQAFRAKNAQNSPKKTEKLSETSKKD